MRSARTHLRTRVESTGMNYKGFNIAVHEMGHNVEQTFSLERVDHTLLRSVPNTAFTEALAFVFQARDLELLGLSAPTAENRALETLDSFWSTCEIAAVALTWLSGTGCMTTRTRPPPSCARRHSGPHVMSRTGTSPRSSAPETSCCWGSTRT